MSRNSRTVLGLVAVVLTMGALSWAAVPFYNWFCRVTGFGGTTQRSEAAPEVRCTLRVWPNYSCAQTQRRVA